MKVKSLDCIKIALIILLLGFVFLNGCVQSPQSSCKDVQVPYSENPCPNQIIVNYIKNSKMEDIQTTKQYECPNLAGPTNYGHVEVTWEFINRNNLLITPSCNVLIIKHNARTNEILDKKIVDTIKINIPPQGTVQVPKKVYLEPCYDYIEAECNDLNELAVCKPITKYRIENKCN